jgi:hypothetical protein
VQVDIEIPKQDPVVEYGFIVEDRPSGHSVIEALLFGRVALSRCINVGNVDSS